MVNVLIVADGFGDSCMKSLEFIVFSLFSIVQ